MSDVILVLGPVAFGAYEVPERIAFGGRQRLAVHRLPGGARVIDALGRDDAELIWTGAFSGPDATVRARALDVLRVQGAVLPLTWDVFFYSVVIGEFVADYENPFWVPYRLRCTVLRDEVEAVGAAVVSLAGALAADLGGAVASASAGGVDVAPAQTAAVAPGATVVGSAAYAQAANAVAASQAAVSAGMDAAGAQVGSAPIGSAAALGSVVAASGQLASLTVARGYLGRAAANLRNAGG